MSVLLVTCHGRDYLAVVPQEIHDELMKNFKGWMRFLLVKVEW